MKDEIINILLVEDEETHAELVELSFEPLSDKYQLNIAKTLHEARTLLKETPPDLVIAYMKLPDGNSIELLPGSIDKAEIPFIIITGYGNERAAVEIIRKGALNFVSKSMKTFADMPKIVEHALREWEHIANLKKSREELKQETKTRKILLDQLPCIAMIQKRETREIVAANKAAYEIGAVPGKTCSVICENQNDICSDCLAPKLWETNQPQQVEVMENGKHYDRRWIPLDEELYVHYIFDITDLKQTETELRKSQEIFSKAFHSNASLMSLSTLEEGVIIDANNQLLKTLGYERNEVIGKSSLELNFFEDFEQRNLLKQKIKKDGFLKNTEINVRTKSGEIRNVIFSSDIVELQNESCWLNVFYDITERKKTEEENRKLERQLIQVHKMEAIGSLAAGIAHDFNNILAGIFGYTELSLIKAEQGTNLNRNLQKILTASKRARDLVKHILTFSHQSSQELIPIQISPIIKEVLKFIRASIPTSIDIRQKLESDPIMLADPTQIHQVIMNLCTNAAQAMLNKEGILEVALESVELDSEFTDRNIGLEPGVHVKLTISDDGIGFSEELAERIFEPFFTTKEKDIGTGMGLAVVHGIVMNHNGIIMVSSNPGKGSVFTIFFPASERRIDGDERPKRAITGGTESILFVDDEAPIVELNIVLLESLGYKVTGVECSVKALELFTKNPDQFDLVITDLTMPKLSGDHLARKLLKIKPDIPIILCTGFSATSNEKDAEEIGILAFIRKPILRREIAETIRNVLGN